MERAFVISAPYVVSEVIDGEAVIMDLRTGNYFSTIGTGAQIWQDVERRRSYRQILQSLTARHDIERSALQDAVDRFLADLIANRLVEELTLENPTNEIPRSEGNEATAAPRAFDPPVLTMHTDLQDLLLLDPVHDVDSAGWPTRKS